MSTSIPTDMIERPTRTWTPDQFFEFLSGYVGEHECGQIKDMLKEHGLAVAPALGDTHVVVPREPTADMLAAAFPCSADDDFTHEDKVLGAAACLKLGGGANIGLLEGHAVKQAAFLARDYRLMIAAATGSQE